MPTASRTIGIVVARGGSKGLPGKNLMMIEGKPMVAWSILAAKAAQTTDVVVVSSDSPDILSVGRSMGCSCIERPADLAQDDSPVIDTIRHTLRVFEGVYDRMVLLQATSPLRTADDIDAAVRMSGPVVSVSPSAKPINWVLTLTKDGLIRPARGHWDGFLPRQEVEPTYMPNGAIFCADTDWLLEHGTFYDDTTTAYVMPPERSVDVDTEIDMELARILMAKREKRDAA